MRSNQKVGDLLKKHTTLVVICFILLLVSIIGISFAMVTTSLDIKGKMKMASANWNVHFENLQQAKLSGTAIEMDKPSIIDDSTSIVNVNVKLQQPSDSVSYSFDVVNDGGLDAELSSYQIADPVCIGKGEKALEDAKTVCENIKYELTYEDGSKMNVGDALKTSQKKTLKLKLSFIGTQLPLNEVDVSNLSIALSYSQM